MSLINELESVEAFVKTVHPTSATEKQTVPRKPHPDLFVIRFQNDDRTSETAYHYRIDREYQIVYIGDSEADVITKMDALSTALYQRQLILINGSLRNLCVESFSFSQPFRTENELVACIGVLAVEVREARNQSEDPLIQHVYVRQTTTGAP